MSAGKDDVMDTIVTGMLALRRLVLGIAGLLAWLPPTLARLTVGWIFLWSGWGKLHALDGVIEFFGQLGIPYPELQAPFASATELVCGALLLAGLCTRIASVPLIVVMLVAIATAQRENVAALGDLFGLSEYLYVTLLVWLAIAGPGPLSLDAALLRLLERREAAPERDRGSAIDPRIMRRQLGSTVR
jgi:putative oxidoreductase